MGKKQYEDRRDDQLVVDIDIVKCEVALLTSFEQRRHQKRAVHNRRLTHYENESADRIVDAENSDHSGRVRFSSPFRVRDHDDSPRTEVEEKTVDEFLRVMSLADDLPRAGTCLLAEAFCSVLNGFEQRRSGNLLEINLEVVFWS